MTVYNKDVVFNCYAKWFYTVISYLLIVFLSNYLFKLLLRSSLLLFYSSLSYKLGDILYLCVFLYNDLQNWNYFF